MGVIVKLIPQYSYIHEELTDIAIKEPKAIQIIEDYLNMQGICSLNDVDLSSAIAFHQYVNSNYRLSENQRKHYASSLETAIRLFHGPTTVLADFHFERAIQNKLLFFLALNRVEQIADITATLRVEYEEYLIQTNVRKIASYLKAMDIAKMSSIRSIQNTIEAQVFRYKNDMFYLTYHPNYEIAERFLYTSNKKPLFFDFSVSLNGKIKEQVFSLLKYFLEEKQDISTHMLLQNYITPLWDLYNYCIEHNLTDISKIKRSDIVDFHQYQDHLSTKPTSSSRAIVGTLRKHIFLTNPIIDWEASAWYMERFHLTAGRVNPARPVEAFYFDEISNRENLLLFKSYVKYLIGLSNRLSITSIYASYSCINQFLGFLDHKDISIKSITNANLEDYIKTLYITNNKGSTTNRHISQLEKFLKYLVAKNYIQTLDFYFEKYRSTEIHCHNDISVSKQDQQRVFDVLDQFPEHLRLMFLNLWCIGLRVNEVCTIKGNAYLFDGVTAWFLIYQNKAKREKRVPIPNELYDLMTDYIRKHNIQTTDYVFPAPNASGAYRAATFTKQVNTLLTKLGVSDDYHFRSHGYRHTLATELYMDGLNIQCIREYLGHAHEDMTKQYIDHLYNEIDKQNEEYFKEKNKEEYQWI